MKLKTNKYLQIVNFLQDIIAETIEVQRQGCWYLL